MMSTNSGASWRWRRIVFAAKGLAQSIPGFYGNYETSNGWPRALIDYSGNGPATIRNEWENFMFEGAGLIDWYNVYTAKVDTKRCTLMYDKTRIIRSGNANGTFAQSKLWHPLNKNVVYNNDELGESKTNQTTSTLSKAGAGDVYIVDLLTCNTGSATDSIAFEPECTTYWHEK